MEILILAIILLVSGVALQLIAFRNVFGSKQDAKVEIDPETGEEVLSGQIIESGVRS